MAKLTLSDLASLANETSAINTINNNSALIETALENTLSRDGTTPNTMTADIDMNSNDLLNVGIVNATQLKVGGIDAALLGDVTVRGGWLTGTAYVQLDLVTESGTTYICLEDHTSGTFLTDLTAEKWAAIEANYVPYAVAITGGTITGITDLAIADGGTGASTAAAARNNLGVPATTETKNTGYTIVAGDRGKLIVGTTTLTLSLTAAATLGNSFYVYVRAAGGVVTIDPDGSETIDGAATTTLQDTEAAIIFCDGSNFRTVKGSAGGGRFKGENGEVGASAGDIFRVNEQTLNTDVTIDADENASATGPLTVASGVTLTVSSGGTLAII